MQRETLRILLPELDDGVLRRALLNTNFKSAVSDLQTAIDELERPNQDAWSREHWSLTKGELLDELRRLALKVNQVSVGEA